MEVGRGKVCSLVAIWGTPPFQNLVIIGILRVSLAEAPILSAPSWKQRSHLLLPESLYFGEASCSGISASYLSISLGSLSPGFQPPFLMYQ